MRTKLDTELTTIRTVDFDRLMDIMAGLGVPYSLNPSMLGAAAGPWVELHREHGLGYPSAEEYGGSFISYGKALKAQLEEELNS